MATLSKMDGRWINEEKPGGLVFFVSGGTAAYTEGHGKALQGSDGHDGLTPERPLSTIDGTYGAVSKAVAGRGDTIVVLPGTVTITAAIGLDKDDLTLTGATNTGSKSRNPSIITSATNTIVSISVDAANVTVENLTLTSTAGTSDVFMINVGATTASPGAIIRNVFLDHEGNTGGNYNGIIIGDGTLVSDYCVIEGCVLYDYDDVGITVSDVSEGCLIRDCDIFDGVSANIGLEGIRILADHCHIEDCYVKNSTAGATGHCINIGTGATDTFIKHCDLSVWGAGGHGLSYNSTTASGAAHDIHVVANALADSVQHNGQVNGISGDIGIVAAPADGTVCELLNPAAA